MKKIFTIDQFGTNERGEYTLAKVTPAEYLAKLYSNIANGELYIAKFADEEVCSLDTAAGLAEATQVWRCAVDASKADAAAVAAKEQELHAACKSIAARHAEKEKAMAAVRAAVEAVIERGGIRVASAVNRAQRLEKLYELGAPDFIIAAERRCLAEELALNAIASSCEEIGKEDFARLQDA